jgi:hypothetical protein
VYVLKEGPMSVTAKLSGGFFALLVLFVMAQGSDSTETSSLGLKTTQTVSQVPSSTAGSSRGEMPVEEDIAKKVINAVNLNPAGMIWGNINASYERFLPDKHGAMLQLGYYLQGGISIAAHYRYHYFKDDQFGLNSYFIGGFIKYVNTKDEADIDGNDGSIIVFSPKVSYLNIGGYWGRRWILSNAMNICARIGYGIPVMAQFTWPEIPKPSNASSIEMKKTIWQGIDAELSLGYTF